MSILSAQPDGMGFYYGFAPNDCRRIDVRQGPVDLLWRAHIGGERIGDYQDGVWSTKAEAEAAAVRWLGEHRK